MTTSSSWTPPGSDRTPRGRRRSDCDERPSVTRTKSDLEGSGGKIKIFLLSQVADRFLAVKGIFLSTGPEEYIDLDMLIMGCGIALQPKNNKHSKKDIQTLL